MKSKALIFLSLHICLPMQADVFGAYSHSLTQEWEFLRGDAGSVWEVLRPIPAPGKPEEVPLWTSVSLPHCFNATDAVNPEVNYYQGPGWYRTVLSDSLLHSLSLDVSSTDSSSPDLFLNFEGAGQVSDVYLYTTHVAHHVGGYDMWQANLTEAARSFVDKYPDEHKRFGGLPLAVRCDNSRNVEVIPSDMSDFNLYGGLYRKVSLLVAPKTRLSQFQVDAAVDEKGKNGEVRIHWTFADSSSLDSLTVCLKDADGRLLEQRHLSNAATSGSTTILVRKPHLWNPSDAYLYTCQMTWSDSEGQQQYSAQKTIGFRHIRFEKNGPFYLNGRRLLLQGTHRHEDHAGVGAALTDAMMLQEMLQIKQLGANFIRLGHYQQSDRILQLCDSLGILVWEEIPWCRGGVGGTDYRSQAHRMLENMIAQHRHHPSVLLWGMGNEIDWPGDFPIFEKDSIRAFLSELVAHSHQLDNSRPTSLRRCDFARDIVDVYSPSIWAGWYSSRFTDFASMERKGFESVDRFLHVEWGGDSHVGRHLELPLDQQMATVRGDANGQWDETYISLLFDWTLKEQLAMPWLTGTAIWTFKDFSTPLRPRNPIPYVNQKGLVQRDGTPKEAYYVVQSYWAEKPMVHIYGHSWPIRWGKADKEKRIDVYSNAPEVELLLDGKSLGRKKRDAADFPAAGLRWNTTLPALEYTLVAIARDAKGRTLCSDTLTQRYETRVWGAPARIILCEKTLPDSSRCIEAQVVDAQGVPCLDCAGFITWGCTDAKRLLVHQGTATGSSCIQAANGRSTIIVRDGAVPAVVSCRLDDTTVNAFITIE